jgi:hypothetical protein
MFLFGFRPVPDFWLLLNDNTNISHIFLYSKLFLLFFYFFFVKVLLTIFHPSDPGPTVNIDGHVPNKIKQDRRDHGPECLHVPNNIHLISTVLVPEEIKNPRISTRV